MNLAPQPPTAEPDPSIATAANGRSPKRKRTDSVDLKASDVEFAPALKLPPTSIERSSSPFGPPLSTPPQQIASEECAVEQGSPRTVVAKSFENLALRESETGREKEVLHFGSGSSVPQEVKRARFAEHIDVEPPPDCVAGPAPSTTQDSTNGVPAIVNPPPPPRQLSRKSPPPATLSGSHIITTPDGTPFDIDFSALTWQDSEITGHLALDPDDDLTGMNGIGFKPTPQIAYARAQARRRQVAEWKHREAREARARRAEARKRGMVARADAERDGKAARVVRFAA